MNFRENFKKDMKKCDHHIADLRKQLASRYASVEKVRAQDAGQMGNRGLLKENGVQNSRASCAKARWVGRWTPAHA